MKICPECRFFRRHKVYKHLSSGNFVYELEGCDKVKDFWMARLPGGPCGPNGNLWSAAPPPPVRVFTPEEQLIAKHAAMGLSVVDIAKRHGVKAAEMRKRLRNLGLEPTPEAEAAAIEARREMWRKRADEAFSLRQQGWTYARIGAHLGVTGSRASTLAYRGERRKGKGHV